MALRISDLDGTVVAPGGAYPYGDVKNAPLGTKVNKKMVDDLLQMAQRIMADAGVTPSGSPDNTANGYQIVQALNTLYCRRFSGMAAAAGTPAGTHVPVVMSGMTPVSYGYTSGYFFYNGLFYFAPTWVNTTAPTIGHSIVLTLGTLDAQPVVTGTGIATTVTPGAASFNYENLVTWSASVGIDNLNTEVAANTAAIGVLNANIVTINTIPAWTNYGGSYGTNWAPGSSTLRYTKDSSGRVYLQGYVHASGAPANAVFTLPVGYRPSVNTNFTIAGLNSAVPTVLFASVNPSTGLVTVNASGMVSGDNAYFDNIMFPII